MNIILLLVLSFVFFNYFFDLLLTFLNLKRYTVPVPELVNDVYELEEYQKSQQYQAVKSKFSILSSTFSLVVLCFVLFFDGFNYLDLLIRTYSDSSIVLGTAYFLLMALMLQFIKLPFDCYDTFVTEQRFGFNKTTVKTFILDIIKSLCVSLILFIPIFSLILWFFQTFQTWAWLYVWVSLTLFQIVMLFVAPVLIMPLFNKYEPLKDKQLEGVILDYANSQNFSLKGVFQMDGSKRSTKSNAFFTGFGPFKRVVLFDTLIAKHSHENLKVVVAHEVGHYKHKHLYKMFILGSFSMFLMLFLLNMAIHSDSLSAAFGFNTPSLYANLLVFSFLYQPLDFISSFFIQALSRKHEYEADCFAVKTTKNPKALIDALKKLTKDNLTLLTPHPFVVFCQYSHPPLLQRIRAIMAVKF